MQDQTKKVEEIIIWGQWQNLSPEQRAVVKQNWDFIIENYPTVQFLNYSMYSRILYLEATHPETSIYKGMTTLIAVSLNGNVSMTTIKDK